MSQTKEEKQWEAINAHAKALLNVGQRLFPPDEVGGPHPALAASLCSVMDAGTKDRVENPWDLCGNALGIALANFLRAADPPMTLAQVGSLVQLIGNQTINCMQQSGTVDMSEIHELIEAVEVEAPPVMQ